MNLAQKNVIFQTSFSFNLSKQLKEDISLGKMLKAVLEQTYGYTVAYNY